MIIKKDTKGFTLIEMAIVLVVIGLILGMVYKSRQLIDSAKVKKMAAQYNKIIAGMNTFYDRYGSFPGDGCGTSSSYNINAPNPMDCDGEKNGVIEGLSNNNWPGQYDREAFAFWQLLIDKTQILTKADRESIFGQPWDLQQGLTSFADTNTDWLDLPGNDQADLRLVCALDKKIDDGLPSSGNVRTVNSNQYNSDSDCWSLNGQIDVKLKVLP